MDRMTGHDASLLYMETPTHFNVGYGLMFIEPPAGSGMFSFESFKGWLSGRCDEIATYRQHAYKPWWNFSHPVWRPDPNFDIDNHLHYLKISGRQAGDGELLTLCGHLASMPMDLTRPLWEWWYLDSLDNGTVAMFTKVHESCIDGVQGTTLTRQTTGAISNDSPEILIRDHGTPGTREIFVTGLLERASRPAYLVAQIWRTAALTLRKNQKPSSDLLPRAFTAPRTHFNRTLTANRNLAYARLDLKAVKAVKNHYRTTVNTVVLYLVASALRNYLLCADDLPDGPLVAYIPKAVHGAPGVEGRNQTSGFLTYLHTEVVDAEQRMSKTIASASTSRSYFESLGPTLISDWARFSSPLWGKGLRLYSRLRLADKHKVLQYLVISNIGGGLIDLDLGGARVVDLIPFASIYDGSALFVGITSVNDNLDIGLIGCPEYTPDIGYLAEQLSKELDGIAIFSGRAED